MTQSCDVAIVGGGVIGSAIAYFLLGPMGFPGRVIVVEKDPTYADAATSRSAGGIRQQFSTPENIAMSSFGATFVKHVGEHLSVEGEAPSIPFTEWGYLFLATPAGLPMLEANHRTQRGLGADIALLDPAALKARFPWLKTDDLAGGTLGLSNEGWIDPYSLLQAFRRKARALGAVYLTDEVVGLERQGNRIAALTLAQGGRIACGELVDSAGYHAHEVAAMAGIDLPVRPRKRFVFVFDCQEPVERAPLLIDPSGRLFPARGRQLHRRRLAARRPGSRLHRFRDRLPAVRGGGLADPGRSACPPSRRSSWSAPGPGTTTTTRSTRTRSWVPIPRSGTSISPTASAAMGCSNRRRSAAPSPS